MDSDLERDIRRSVLLGTYMRAWGMPIMRSLASRSETIVEIYSFPGKQGEKINRFATVGVSSLCRDDGQLADWELMLVVPADNGGASVKEITSLLVDVAAYSLRDDVRFHIGQTIPPCNSLPSTWAARAMLLDEPRGESAELADQHVGRQHVNVIWIVPIHAEERELIVSHGIEAFDHAEAASPWSLADPNRPPVTR